MPTEMTSPTPENLAYARRQQHYHCKKGDRVKVIARSASYDAGWGTIWVNVMDRAIGQYCIIEGIDDIYGILLRFGNGVGERVFFPYFVLSLPR
jgi:hypothetical protein